MLAGLRRILRAVAAPDRSVTLRLSSLLGPLSLVADLGMSFPPEHAARACLLATLLAERISLRAGDTYCLRLPTYFRPRVFHQPPPPLFPSCFFLSAIWTPIRANDPYWGGEPPTGFVLERGTYFRVLASLIPVVPPDVTASIEPSGAYAGQYWAPDLARFHAANVPRELSTLTRVQGEFTVGRDVSFITGLPDALRAFEARLDNARLAGLLVQVSLLAIAFYAVGLMGSLFLDGQLAAVALCRARGWSRRRLWWLLMLQFAIISLLAAPLGLFLAFKAVQMLAAAVLGPTARVSSADLPGLEPALVGAIAAGLALLGWQASRATDRGLVDARRQASRPAARPWWRARNLDLLLAGIGAGLLSYAHFSNRAIAT